MPACWDSDKLDLGKVHIKPMAHELCTSAAKGPGMIAWAYRLPKTSLSDASSAYGEATPLCGAALDSEPQGRKWWTDRTVSRASATWL
ncbi:MAG: hypothetical protein AB1646_11705 [Thermodesulfobacteriota bacterium]